MNRSFEALVDGVRRGARLQDLHDQILRGGAFYSTTSRTLFEVRKPTYS